MTVTIEIEFLNNMLDKAASELVNPVLFRTDVPGLSQEHQEMLHTLQETQAQYTLQARRAVTGKLDMPYFFEKMELPAWHEFAHAVAPEFVEATFQRRNTETRIGAVVTREREYTCRRVLSTDDYTREREEYWNLSRQLRDGLAMFYPREETPFAVHYAVTAHLINRDLKGYWKIEGRISPEDLSHLRQITPDDDTLLRLRTRPHEIALLLGEIDTSIVVEDIARSLEWHLPGIDLESLEIKGSASRAVDALTAFYNKQSGAGISQYGSIPRISPDEFPYKEKHFVKREGRLPEGVTDLNGLKEWYVQRITQILQRD